MMITRKNRHTGTKLDTEWEPGVLERMRYKCGDDNPAFGIIRKVERGLEPRAGLGPCLGCEDDRHGSVLGVGPAMF